MGQGDVGVATHGTGTTDQTLEMIELAEALGIPCVWMTTGGVRLDSITTFAAAALRTKKINFGTAIVPTFPRHPLVVAQQVQVVAHLAPGRFRLGVGPSHRPSMEVMGLDFYEPLGHLREYLKILKTLFQTGTVDFDGVHYRAHEKMSRPVDVPVIASALRPGAYELCGEEADGAVSWICPGTYLRDVALPALRSGAERAGRPVPPLIAHAPVCLHENVDEVRAAVREQISNPKLPYYQFMLREAGFPEATSGGWSDAMVDSIVLWGDEARVSERVEELFSFGVNEVLAMPVAAGKNKAASADRAMRFLGKLAKPA